MTDRRFSILHPLPVSAPVKLIGELPDFRFLRCLVPIIGLGNQHAGK